MWLIVCFLLTSNLLLFDFNSFYRFSFKNKRWKSIKPFWLRRESAMHAPTFRIERVFNGFQVEYYICQTIKQFSQFRSLLLFFILLAFNSENCVSLGEYKRKRVPPVMDLPVKVFYQKKENQCFLPQNDGFDGKPKEKRVWRAWRCGARGSLYHGAHPVLLFHLSYTYT